MQVISKMKKEKAVQKSFTSFMNTVMSSEERSPSKIALVQKAAFGMEIWARWCEFMAETLHRILSLSVPRVTTRNLCRHDSF